MVFEKVEEGNLSLMTKICISQHWTIYLWWISCMLKFEDRNLWRFVLVDEDCISKSVKCWVLEDLLKNCEENKDHIVGRDDVAWPKWPILWLKVLLGGKYYIPPWQCSLSVHTRLVNLGMGQWSEIRAIGSIRYILW